MALPKLFSRKKPEVDPAQDESFISHLVELAVDFACAHLRPQGALELAVRGSTDSRDHDDPHQGQGRRLHDDASAGDRYSRTGGLGRNIDAQVAEDMPWWARQVFTYEKDVPARDQLDAARKDTKEGGQ